jgi:hypothetical protein
MEDKENNEKLLEYEKKRKEYQEELKQKILKNKLKQEEEYSQVKKQLDRLNNLPKDEQKKLLNNMLYWNLSGIAYFVYGFFFIRRPKRIMKRILFWVPSLIIFEYYIFSHYFWSVKEENETKEEKEKPIPKEQITKEKFDADDVQH